MTARAYEIAVPEAKITALKERLALTSWPDELDDSAWAYGAPLADVKRLAAYWQHEFDWRKVEAKLNELPNFMTSVAVDGYGPLDVHFVHQKSAVQGAIPLLFSHGWPGSFMEVIKLLPQLDGSTGGPAFHVVAPSLPNFAFSAGVKTKGFALAQYAETCHKLMLSLGYDQYVTQGGDWGCMITRCIGLLYPSHCLASHINMIRASPPTFTSHPLLALQHAVTPYSAADRAGLARGQWFASEGSGYRMEQSTRPQTLGFALADSPVGLLAWLYEKLHDWTDGYAWTPDEILTWVALYAFSTAGPTASLRIYYEVAHGPAATSRDRVFQHIPHVKLGMAYFPKELGTVPKTWGRTMGPVVWESEHDRGGHFAAHEQPDAIIKDLHGMFQKGGPCYGIVKGKDGYDHGARL